MLKNILYTSMLIFSCSILMVFFFCNSSGDKRGKEQLSSQNKPLSPFEKRMKNLVMHNFRLN